MNPEALREEAAEFDQARLALAKALDALDTRPDLHTHLDTAKHVIRLLMRTLRLDAIDLEIEAQRIEDEEGAEVGT